MKSVSFQVLTFVFSLVSAFDLKKKMQEFIIWIKIKVYN